jgi:Beta-galactosidase
MKPSPAVVPLIQKNLRILLLVLAAASSPGAAAQRFVQDRFAIGMWVPPATSENLDARYQEIALANFNLVIGMSGTNAQEHVDRCQRFGLKAIPPADGALEKLPDGPACWGYLLADEPSPGAFADLARRAQEIRTSHPGRFGYVNLYPNYCPLSALGTPNYDEHVALFVRQVKPEVLSMDHYPVMRPERDTRNDYCANLESFRKQSLAAGIPFWNYFCSMPFNDHLDPTEAQLRWQMFASVAYGAKGVLYFCYWTPGKGAAGAGEFPKGGAVLTAEGLKTRHYDEARRINAELKHLGPTLMKLTSTGVYRVTTETNASALAGSPVRSLARVPGDPVGEFIVGTFRHADRRRAVVIVNHNYSYTAWPTVRFDAEPQEVLEVSKTTGKALPVVDDSPELKGLQLSFGPGDGRLFLLPPAK